MNTIKITPLYNLLTEQHDLSNEKLVYDNYYGMIKTPVNINVFIGSKCPCNCKFCFSKDINKTNEITDDEYIENFEKFFNYHDPKNFEVTITGGEPTLKCYRNKLINIMRLCKKLSIKERTFSTLGISIDHELVKEMVKNGFIHNINISRMHYEESLIDFGFPNLQFINKLFMLFKVYGIDARLSCNLITGKIENWKDIKNYMNFYNKLDINSFLFREIQNTKIYKENISIQNILYRDILKERDFKKVNELSNEYYVVDIFANKDLLMKVYNYKGNHVDYITHLVYYEGKMYKNWNRLER